MSVVLMVAEKPMLAEAIARILSNGKMEKRRGWNGICSVFEYTGSFLKRNAFFKMTSTCGHVRSLDFEPRYNDWQKTDPVELFNAVTEKKDADPSMRMSDFLATEARNCDYLVLWLDCDKEGENICFEVINAVEKTMKQPRSGDLMENVYRAHFSAATPKEIKDAMMKLGRPNYNESLSVDVRQELDLRIGCAFTRFQTRYFQGKYGDLDSSCISFGPCQTPTLGFCVTRHDEIMQFKPEQYWTIKTTFETSELVQVTPTYAEGRIFDKAFAQVILDRVKAVGTGTVIESSVKEGRKEPPLPLNTVEMLKVASSAFSISPASAMHIAETLYTKGYISYPRTETTTYPKTFDPRDALRQQRNDQRWGAIADKLAAAPIRINMKGEDKGDHPPIVPLRADDGYLSGDAKTLYDYIVQHFIGTLMRDCRFYVTTVRILVGEETFTMSGRISLESGYTEVMTWNAITTDLLPFLKVDEILTLK